MEALTRLVAESLARHGFDRPPDYRRLHWSRWFRCQSHHSLLFVPSKPGVFAVAEEIMDLSTAERPAPDAPSTRRMLAVTQFFEDDDMAFVLDRMLSRENPMCARLISGRYFVRFVVIEDQSQRRSICTALNQWMMNSGENATGIGSHFANSLELTPATEYIPQPDAAQQSLFPDANADDSNAARGPSPASAGNTIAQGATGASPVPRSEASGSATGHALSTPTFSPTSPHLDSGAAANIHCPSPLPSGF